MTTPTYPRIFPPVARCLAAALMLSGLSSTRLAAGSHYLLLGSTWGQSGGESLCVVDTHTGLATAYTVTGDVNLMGIAYDEIGDKLYAATTHASFYSSRLIEVDRFSGEIGDYHSVGMGNFPSVPEGDVAVQKSTGYVFALRSGGSVHVWNSVDKKFVRSFSLAETNDYSCIAFNAAGDLYVVDPNSRTADPPHLLRIDPINGTILQTTVLDTDIGVVAGLAFHPLTDQAWLADSCRGDDTCIGSRLFQVNLTTGALTLVGSTGLALAGLTFVPEVPAAGSGQIAIFDGAADIAPPLTHNQAVPVNFGMLVRNTSSARPITLKNTGGDPLTIHRVGALGAYAVSGLPALPAILAPGASTTFNLAIQTGGGGTYAGALRIFSSDDNPHEASIPLTAQVPLIKEIRVLGPSGELTDGQLDPVVFQAGFAAAPSASFQVINDGPESLTLSSVSIPAGFSVSFSQSSFATTLPGTIASGQSVGVHLITTGPAAGAYGGVVTFFNDDDDEGEFTFPISALHNVPEIQVVANFSAEVQSGGALDFGTATFGQAVNRNLRITNLYPSTLTISGITLPAGFVFAAPPTFPIHLAQSGLRDIGIRMAATSSGNFNGTLVIDNNDYDESAFELDLFGNVREDSIQFFGFSPQIHEHPSPQVGAFAYGFNFGPVTYEWDLDGDGDFDDFTGQDVPLTGADGPADFAARVRITDSRSSAVFTGTVPYINSVPSLSASPSGSFAAGIPSTFTLTADDAAPDVAAGFTWAVDWGDGTAETSNPGAAASRAFSHTYAQPGVQRQITITATDKDGGTGQFDLSEWIHSGVTGVFDGPNLEGTPLRDGQDTLSFFTSLDLPEDHQITLLNRSASPATIGPVTLPIGFALVNAPAFPATLQPQETLTLTLRFLANTFGTFSGNLAFATSDPLMPSFGIHLQAEVEAPDLIINQYSQEKYNVANHAGRFQVFPGTGTFDGLLLNIDHSGPPLVISAIELPPGFALRDAPAFPLTIDGNTGSLDIRIQVNGPNPSLLKGRVKILSNDPDESPYTFYVSSSVGSLPDLLAVTAEGAADYDSGSSAAGILLHNQAEPLVFTTPGPSERGVVVFNQGNETLTLTGATLPPGFEFIAPPAFPIDITFAGRHDLPAIRFTGTAPGSYSGHLEIAGNDPDENPYRIPLLAVVEGGEITPPAYASTPVITRATATTAASFSASLTGTAGAVVKLEASTDLGLTDPWQVIGQITLDGLGNGTFTNIIDPASVGETSDFFRLRNN